MIESTAQEPLRGPIPEATPENRATPPPLVASIQEIAYSRLITVDTDTPLAKVAALLSAAQISMVVVCDTSGSVVGVITETLLIRQLGFGNADVLATQAGEVMNRDFTACVATDSLSAVLTMMRARGLIHVLIVESGQKPVGVLNTRDGLRALLAAGHREEALLRSYVMGVGYQ